MNDEDEKELPEPPKTPHEIWAKAVVNVALIIALAHLLSINGCAVTLK